MRLALAIHILLFFFSFAVVGFMSSLINFLMASWTYSITLTLREKQMIFYIFILFFGILEALFSFYSEKHGNL